VQKWFNQNTRQTWKRSGTCRDGLIPFPIPVQQCNNPEQGYEIQGHLESQGEISLSAFVFTVGTIGEIELHYSRLLKFKFAANTLMGD
jgi:hypothetical protein